MEDRKKMLVISSHAVDFLWRAGGTIARYGELGWDVRVIDLTFGAYGESDAIWEKNPGITVEQVKEIRRKEILEVAKVLGTRVEFMDWNDHLLTFDQERISELARILKEYRPQIILTQFERDSLNYDHPETAHAVFKAIRLANVAGVFPELKRVPRMAVYMYEPSQPDLQGFNPDIYIDISDQFEKKKQAMMAVGAQEYLIESYRVRAAYRGLLATVFHDKKVAYAEGFVRFCPLVKNEFPY